jgi:hemoglobin-like flavoprotein
MAVDFVPPSSPDSSDPIPPDIVGAPSSVPTTPTPPPVGADPNAQQQQPAAPPRETFGEGVARGIRGRQYVVDGSGAVAEARTTSPSASGSFGSILSGVVMGALQGARASRPGKIPSQEIGGGFGAGVASAQDAQQQQDTRNRAQAQQTFANKQSVAKLSRDQAESAAQINHLAADTARIAQEAKFADEEHPLHVAALKAGLDETSQNIQKNSQEILSNQLAMAQTLGEVLPPAAVSAFVTNWKDAHGHIQDIVQGRTAPIHNGEDGEDSAVGMYNVQMLKSTPLPQSVKYNTYTQGKNGEPIAQQNTLPAGSSAFDYVIAAMAGNGQLQKINSQLRIQQAADLNKADIRSKNASAFRDTAEGQKAQQDAALTKSLVGGGGNGAPVKLDPNTHADEEFLSSLPASRAAMIREVGEGKAYSARLFSGKDGEVLLQQLSRAYGGQWDQSKAESYFKMRQDFTSGKTSQALNAYNTAIAHLGTMWDHVQNSNSISINTPGTDVHRQLNQDLQLVSTELTKAVSNGQMTEGEKKDILNSLKSYTVHGYQTNIKEAAQLLHGKQESYAEQWANGAPPAAVAQVPVVSKQAEATLARINGNAAASQSQPQQARPTQPQAQIFNPAKWQAAHPGQDVNAAIAYAQSQGIQVKQ